MPLLLLPKSQPLRWVAIWPPPEGRHLIFADKEPAASTCAEGG